MNVLSVTILVSLCLAGIFTVSFAMQCYLRRDASSDRDALMPLDDGKKISSEDEP